MVERNIATYWDDGKLETMELDVEECKRNCDPFHCSLGLMGCSGKDGKFFTKDEIKEIYSICDSK